MRYVWSEGGRRWEMGDGRVGGVRVRTYAAATATNAETAVMVNFMLAVELS
jgi:hypothetical protein